MIQFPILIVHHIYPSLAYIDEQIKGTPTPLHNASIARTTKLIFISLPLVLLLVSSKLVEETVHSRGRLLPLVIGRHQHARRLFICRSMPIGWEQLA